MASTFNCMLNPKSLPNRFDIEVKTKEEIDELFFQSIPGDKSISQRAIILNALAKGRGKVKGVLQSDDIYNCVNALDQLGVGFEWQNDDLVVEGVGLTGFTPSKKELYMGNTATSSRIIMSILAGSPFKSEIAGNMTLSKRPMWWVTSHLMKMGAKINFKEKYNCLPLIIEGKYPLNPVSVSATVASAQEKSVVLFAGMFADGTTEYEQLCQSRDHTERMMKYFGLPVEIRGNMSKIRGMHYYNAKDIEVPRDISSAAYMITAYLIRKDKMKSKMTLKGIGINHTRTGYMDVLKKMGAVIEYENIREASDEPMADIVCTHRDILVGIEVEGMELVQSLIDETVLLAVAAVCADGTTILRDCEELRDKDTNRIETTAQVLRKFGANIQTSPSQITIHGENILHPARVKSYGDHRIAMAAAVLGSSFTEYSYIENCECISISYPTFLEDLSQFAHIRVIPRLI